MASVELTVSGQRGGQIRAGFNGFRAESQEFAIVFDGAAHISLALRGEALPHKIVGSGGSLRQACGMDEAEEKE